MLKQRPKQFWGLLKNKEKSTTDLPLQTFADFNKKIFHDESIPVDTFTPLDNAKKNYITPAELTNVLKYNFKANKSLGLSCMPL